MKPAANIFGKVRRSVEKVAYGNPIYQKILASGETRERLYFAPPDLWPGDAAAGMNMIAMQRSMFDRDVLDGVQIRTSITQELRNLRAVGSEAARHRAVTLIQSGMTRCETWNEKDWHPSLLGERIAAWIGFYEFYAPALPAELSSQLADNIYRQWKHLVRCLPAPLLGASGLEVIRGLIYGALNFSESDDKNRGAPAPALVLACDQLRQQLKAEIFPDGTHRSRNPSVQLRMLQHLLDIQKVFSIAGLPLPEEVTMAITTMAPVLKFYRQSDGGLALFHGSCEEASVVIDAVLAEALVKGRMPRRLTHGGFERVTSGRSLLLVDCGRPPEAQLSHTGHAGIFAFEFSQGKERLIVNCGALPSADGAWRRAMAATAAHSTLTVENINACEVLPEGGVHSFANCSAHRYEQEGAQGVEMRHDGYAARFGIFHQRSLELTRDGEELRGRDVLEGPGGRNYTIRWHLHPSVQASLSHGGQTALLRTASGAGWRLRVDRGKIELEPGVYCGSGQPRRGTQLKVSGVSQEGVTTLSWQFVREKK